MGFPYQLITALPLVIFFPRFYLKTRSWERARDASEGEASALCSFIWLRFFVTCESMGAQISKNGAKDETAAEKPADAANKTNGQVITLITIFVQACDVLRGCAVTLPKTKSVQMNNEPINKGKGSIFHWKTTLCITYRRYCYIKLNDRHTFLDCVNFNFLICTLIGMDSQCNQCVWTPSFFCFFL